MKRNVTLSALFLLLFSIAGFSQVSIKDSSIFVTMVYGTYSFQVPQGDLATRFGGNSTIGGGIMLKSKSNWLFNAEGNYMFGGTVKNSDSLMKGIATSEGFVIDENGYYSSLVFQERGFSIYGKIGKLIPVLSPNPNSGITILAGGGFMQNKIRIHNNDGDITAPLKGDYKKGYDRLNNGFGLTGTIGYTYLSNSRLTNFYIGLDFEQMWTSSRRERDFDTGQKDTRKYSTQFYGFRVDWIIPLYKRKPQAYYLY